MRQGRQFRAVWLFTSAAIGVVWFLYVAGWRTLDPTNLDWITGDHAQHLLGWLFFRNEPLTLPLGTIHGLLYPVGTTVGFMDANPWVALLLWPVSPWLPADFQFIGPWLLLSFVLQGVFGLKIMETLTRDPWHRLAGVAILVTLPVQVSRMGHDTLTAHWLLLGMIWLHLRDGAQDRNTLWWAWTLNVVAAGVHPYLSMMVLPLTLVLLVRRSLGPSALVRRTAVLFGVAVTLQTAAIFALLGYLGADETLSGGGFGTFSADLLTFFNPLGDSRLLPALPVNDGQQEGYGFLGLGVLGLAAVMAVMARVHRYRPTWAPEVWPLVGTALLMALFALSSRVTVGGHVVLTMRSLYEPLEPLVEPMRSSGRFVWPLYYLIVTGLLAVTVGGRLVKPAVATGLLLGALVVQIADFRATPYPSDSSWSRMASPAWDGLDSTYKHVVLYPAYYPIGPGECQPEDPGHTYEDFVRVAYLAYRKGVTFNSGYVARAPMAGLRSYCAELNASVAAGEFAHDTVYVVTRDAIGPFLAPDANATCGVLDGLRVCVADTVRGRFHRLLQDENEAN